MIRQSIATGVTIGALFLVCLGFSHAQGAISKTDVDVKQSTKYCFNGP